MSLLSHLQKTFHVRPTAFGCDISDHSIRLAYLKEEHGLLNLVSFVTHPLPEGAVSGGSIVDADKAALAFREALTLVTGEKIRTPYLVSSLPEPQSFLRIVQLPKLSEKEIAEAIKLEVEANIPLPLGDVYYDWEVSRGGEANPDHLDILVAASPKMLVDAYEQLFSRVGLKPVAFDIDALAIARSIVPSVTLNEVVLIIDIAYHRTTFVVYAGSLVRFTASASVSGKDISTSTLQSVVKRIAAYAHQYIDFFTTHAAHTHLSQVEVKKVIVCGDEMHAQGLVSALALEVGLPVSLANPWVNILHPPLHEVPLLPYKDSLGYATALGLALRGNQELADI